MVLCFNFIEPQSVIRHQELNTKVVLNNSDLGTGTFTVAEDSITWLSTNGSGLTFDYNDIILFAISKDSQIYQSECLYILLEKKNDQENGVGISNGHRNEDLVEQEAHGNVNANNADSDNDNGSDNDDYDGDCDDMDSNEIFFVPENSNNLKTIYDLLANCQRLHPDPNEELSDDQDSNNDDDYDSGYINNDEVSNALESLNIDANQHLHVENNDDNDSLYQDAD